MTATNLHALVPVSPVRTHQTAQQRRQAEVRRTYGAGPVDDHTSFSAEALMRRAVHSSVALEGPTSSLSDDPHTRQRVRFTYGAQPSSYPPQPGSLIDIRV